MDQNYDNESGNGKKTLWIIGGIVLVIMIVALVYGATQKNLATEKVADTDIRKTQQAALPPKTSSSQQPVVAGAVDRVTVVPSITSMDLVNLETLPYQAQVRVQGTLPDGCSIFDTPMITRAKNIITVAITGSHAKDATCSQATTKHSTVVDLPVSGLDDGTYVVKLGTFSKKLTLSHAKAAQHTDDK